MPKHIDDEPLADPLNEGADEPDETPVSRVIAAPPRMVPPKAVFGSLSAADLRACVERGLSVGDVRSMAEAGMSVAEILDVATAQQTPALPTQSDSGSAIADAIGKAIKSNRSRRSESYSGDFDFPGLSVFSPDGKELPPLKCPMFLGIWEKLSDGSTRVTPSYPYIADETGGMTLEERTLMNKLEPGVFHVERRDETKGVVRVVVDLDPAGNPDRIVIAVPKLWLDRLEHRSLPSVSALARQLDPQTGTRVA